MLKPFQTFGRNRAHDLRTVGKAEPEKLPLLRSRRCALRLIHLEFELVRNESRNAFHYPLTRSLAAHVDIAGPRTYMRNGEFIVQRIEQKNLPQWQKRLTGQPKGN
jgi:hypothetical protein